MGKKWRLIINPYQKKIDFISGETMYIQNYLKSKDSLVFFGCITPVEAWEDQMYVGVLGEICIVDLDNLSLQLTGMIATINKEYNGFTEVANGEDRLIRWDTKTIEELKKNIRKIRELKNKKYTVSKIL